MDASEQGHSGIVTLLADSGAQLNMQNNVSLYRIFAPTTKYPIIGL